MYFYVRKYMTTENVWNATGHSFWYRVREEHVSIIRETGSPYFRNVIKQGHLKENSNTCLDSMEVVGCDETVVNTERNDVVIQ